MHAPTSGSIQHARYVPGTLFPVNRIGSEYIPQLLARNERISVLQRSEVHGPVTTILVGAIGVGRVGLAFDDLQTNRGYAIGTRSYAESVISLLLLLDGKPPLGELPHHDRPITIGRTRFLPVAPAEPLGFHSLLHIEPRQTELLFNAGYRDAGEQLRGVLGRESQPRVLV